jgi:hypothetical protein
MTLQFDDFQTPSDFSERLAIPPKVRSPRAAEDIRLHGDWCWADVLMLKHKGQFYLVSKSLAELLAGKTFRASLHAVATGDGDVFAWPVKLDTSAVKAAEAGRERWVRIGWKNSSRSYDIQDAAEQHDDPDWRYASFDQVVTIAFGKRILNSPDDQVVKEILGL